MRCGQRSLTIAVFMHWIVAGSEQLKQGNTDCAATEGLAMIQRQKQVSSKKMLGEMEEVQEKTEEQVIDTLGWTNHHGKTCEDYKNFGWCQDGAFKFAVT